MAACNCSTFAISFLIYGIQVPSEDLTIDNLGSAALMADYLLKRKSAN